jgi:hypothetical protein
MTIVICQWYDLVAQQFTFKIMQTIPFFILQAMRMTSFYVMLELPSTNYMQSDLVTKCAQNFTF